MKMQYQKNIKIIIDKRKLDVLTRIGCPDEKILSLLKTGKFEPTGDKLIDETLECLIDIKEFDNWGGKREGAGRPKKNQDENHLGNQDANQVADIDKDKDRDIDKDSEVIVEIQENERYPTIPNGYRTIPNDILN